MVTGKEKISDLRINRTRLVDIQPKRASKPTFPKQRFPAAGGSAVPRLDTRGQTREVTVSTGNCMRARPMKWVDQEPTGSNRGPCTGHSHERGLWLACLPRRPA